MRKIGLSLLNISRKLSVSKSTVSKWCEDIVLTKNQINKLLNDRNELLTTGRMMGAVVNKRKKLIAIEDANIFGRKFVNKISKRELALVVIALYWAEGSKTSSTSRFMFVNSDPQMILIVKKFLLYNMGISQDDIFCSIQINRIHEKRIKTVLNFWENLLGLPSKQFKKPYYVNTKVNKIYENYDNYFGVCRLIVSKSTYLKYKMVGLIEALKNNILSA